MYKPISDEMFRLAKIYANTGNSPSGEPLIDKYHKMDKIPNDCRSTGWFGFMMGFRVCYELMSRRIVTNDSLDEPKQIEWHDKPV